MRVFSLAMAHNIKLAILYKLYGKKGLFIQNVYMTMNSDLCW